MRGTCWVGMRNGLAAMTPSHWAGTFSAMKRTGTRLSLSPARRTSSVWRKARGNLVEAGDVVLVVLDGVEGHGEREVGEAGVDAAQLPSTRHLVLLQVVVVHALLQVAEEEVVRDAVFFGEAVRGDGLDAGEVGGVDLVASARWRRASCRRAGRCSGSRRRRWRGWGRA